MLTAIIRGGFILRIMNTSRQQSRWSRNAAWLLLALNLSIVSCGKASTMDTVLTKLPPERAALAKQIDDLAGQHIHMPPLPVNYSLDRYINVLPGALRDSLKGKVVLIDIWDYTCVNCIQTLPYIKEWNERYKNKGLVIIG